MQNIEVSADTVVASLTKSAHQALEQAIDTIEDTQEGKTRRWPNDAYYTPPALALAICQTLKPLIKPKVIVEPSAGDGAFIQAAREVWPEAFIAAIETNGAMEEKCLEAGANNFVYGDWEAFAPAIDHTADLVIGNPPYSYAQEHIEAAIDHALTLRSGHLAFLLPLNFLAGQKRATSLWARGRLARVFPIAKRPSFAGQGKTAAVEYGLFVWTNESIPYLSASLHPPIIWE